jgi:hypothetical protein
VVKLMRTLGLHLFPGRGDSAGPISRFLRPPTLRQPQTCRARCSRVRSAGEPAAQNYAPDILRRTDGPPLRGLCRRFTFVAAVGAAGKLERSENRPAVEIVHAPSSAGKVSGDRSLAAPRPRPVLTSTRSKSHFSTLQSTCQAATRDFRIPKNWRKRIAASGARNGGPRRRGGGPPRAVGRRLARVTA